MWMRLAPLTAALLAVSILAGATSQDKVVRPRRGGPGAGRLIGQVTANFTAESRRDRRQGAV